MSRGGVEDQFQVDLAGAGFEFAILIGGIVIGGYVDRSKKYKSVTLACLVATTVCLIPLGLTEHAIGNEPILLVLALMGLGFAAGPVQPINAELAVDVTYPGDETAVESVQQIGGNLISALLVPLAAVALEQDYQLLPSIPELASDIRGDVVLMMGVSIATFIYFAGFDAPLKRSMADEGDGHPDEANGEIAKPMALTTNGESIALTSNGAIIVDAEPVVLGKANILSSANGELELVLDAEVARET
jgi:MFS family permease